MSVLFGSRLVGYQPRNENLNARNIFVYFDVSDMGPDQASRKNKITAELFANDASIIYLPAPCLLHQYHLIVQDGLKFIDEAIKSYFTTAELRRFSRYFGALAAIANSWREKASAVMDEWHRLYGASEQARKFPPHVISGRWGSVDFCEKFLIERGKTKVQQALFNVLSKYVKSTVKDSASAAVPAERAEPLDADAQDDNNLYRLKLSKWFATTFFSIASDIFWFLLFVSNKIREPLRHFFHYMMKHTSDRCLFRLVTLKVSQFRKDLTNLAIELPAFLQSTLELTGCDKLSEETQNKLKLVAFQLLWRQARALDHRIFQRLDQFPGRCQKHTATFKF